MSAVRTAALLSFCVGFLSLSQEILWVRMVGFGHGGRPQAFSLVLIGFLVGIAAGAWWGRRLGQQAGNLRHRAAGLLLLAAVADLITLHLARFALYPTSGQFAALITLLILTAGTKGALFPLVHQMGSAGEGESPRLGRSLSSVYGANVAGSALGPLITGYLVLDWITVESAFAAVALCCALLGLLCGWRFAAPRARVTWLGIVLLATLAVLRPPAVLVAVADGVDEDSPPRHLIQNRQGVIHIAAGFEGGPDTTFGGNVYDGRVQLDMHRNLNGLDRAYLAAILHPAPRRALVIGLSTGAWAQVLRGLPSMEHIDVVEINPGYLDLIGRYPEMQELLSDPRVHLHTDDGRRWLKRHPERRYDLVLSNTTFHWRSGASLLLSDAFLTEVRRHMTPEAVLTFNTTSSLDALATAAAVFPHAARYKNFAYASASPLVRRPDATDWLQRAALNSKPAFTPDLFEPGQIGHRLVHERLIPANEWLAGAQPPAQVITDDNLLSEYRHGRRPLYGWLDRWLPPSPHPD